MKFEFNYVSTEGQENITVFANGGLYVASTLSHGNFEQIKEGVIAGDPAVLDLFDPSVAVARRFEKLTKNFSVANGRLYYKGDEVHNALANRVVQSLSEGDSAWKSLLAFAEKLYANGSDEAARHSRDQLFEWLDRYFDQSPITPNGDFVAYKGVATDSEGNFVSINRGPAIVDGEEVNGAVPNYIGATVEMPASQVEHNPGVGCAPGLHAGTFEYASNWSRGTVLEVHIDPGDVRSVPTDCDAQKIRTSRYVVVDTIDVPYSQAYIGLDEDGITEDPDGEWEDFDTDTEDDLW